MKIKGFVLTTIFTFAYCSFAMAGTLINDEPYTGLYIGGQVGYGHQQDEINGTAAPFTLGVSYGDFGNDGITYGAFAGLGTTLGSMFYIGLEGQYNALDRDSHDVINPAILVRRQTNNEWNAGARLGLVFGENTLVFVRGAYSELSMDIQSITAPFLDVETMDGYQVGLGAEYAFAQYFTLRGEYVYSNYDESDILDLLIPVDVGNINSSSSEARVALTFEF